MKRAHEPTADDGARPSHLQGVPVLSLRGISKSYPGVKALSPLDLDVAAGEAVGLLGQNGAGKSTLVKIISGAEHPSAGQLSVSGERVRFRTPAAAQAAGVHTIYQELSLVPQLSVAENVFVADLPTRAGAVDWARLNHEARAILAELGFDIDITRRVSALPLAQRQAIEIAKAVHSDAKVILLDEPTASLPQPDAEKLFTLLHRLKSEGVALIYVSHRLAEVYSLCERVVVLRDGRHVETTSTTELTEDGAVRLMIGERLATVVHGDHTTSRPRLNKGGAVETSGPPALEVRHLSDGALLDDVCITVMPGEAVAVTGLVGSGQAELAAAIFGSRPHVAGDVLVSGKKVSPSPRSAIAHGLGWVPEERKLQGLVLGMTVAENLTLANLRSVSSRGRLKRGAERRRAESMRSTLGIKTPNVGQSVGSLSGGNQQKVVFGKWIIAGTDVMVLSEPTRGVDVKAKEEIYREISAFLSAGGSILMASSEIDEALMCDRIYVLSRGKVVDELDHDAVDPDELVTVLR